MRTLRNKPVLFATDSRVSGDHSYGYTL